MLEHERIPTVPFLSGRCQRFSNIGAHGVFARVAGRVGFGLGIRSRVVGLLKRQAPSQLPVGALGSASRYSEGQWVRVIDKERMRARLDGKSRLRGLEFSPQQWFSCGRVYRVTTVVRRIIDDGGTLRRVSRTVLVDGVDCGGEHGTAGCGRFCPMMFRDEWLEAAEAPAADPRSPATVTEPTFARVRSVAEIEGTLDLLGRRDGLLFMPEMAHYAGQRHRVSRKISRVWELEAWVDVPAPVFVLEGIRCTGAILRADGPCDRRCHALWHKDWLHFELSGSARPGQVPE